MLGFAPIVALALAASAAEYAPSESMYDVELVSATAFGDDATSILVDAQFRLTRRT